MMLRLVVLLAVAVACLAQSRRPLDTGVGSNPVVVELFTSEGCSSCPAADNLLSRFNRGTQVIVLGEHVDYWDGMGWKDRFASPLFTARQQDYGLAMHSGNVYTPQIVVNGQKEVLGSSLRAVSSAIADASTKTGASVSLRMAHGNVSLSVGKLPVGSHKADVLLGIAEDGLTSNVDAGENIGRQLRHVAVVRTISKLTELDPAQPGEYTAEARLNLRPEWNRANLKVVVLVQDRENRHILGAASVKP